MLSPRFNTLININKVRTPKQVPEVIPNSVQEEPSKNETSGHKTHKKDYRPEAILDKIAMKPYKQLDYMGQLRCKKRIYDMIKNLGQLSIIMEKFWSLRTKVQVSKENKVPH